VGAYFAAASCSLKWVTKRAGSGNEIRSHLVAVSLNIDSIGIAKSPDLLTLLG